MAPLPWCGNVGCTVTQPVPAAQVLRRVSRPGSPRTRTRREGVVVRPKSTGGLHPPRRRVGPFIPEVAASPTPEVRIVPEIRSVRPRPSTRRWSLAAVAVLALAPAVVLAAPAQAASSTGCEGGGYELVNGAGTVVASARTGEVDATLPA